MASGSSSSSEGEALIVPSPFTEFSAYQDLLKKTIISGAQHAARLPPKNDLAFQRTLDRRFGKDLDACSAKILSLMNKMLNIVQGTGVSGSGSGSSKGKARQALEEEDLTEGYHSTMVDVLDGLYESVDASLDEYSGQKQVVAPPLIESKNPAPIRTEKLASNILHAQHLPKPQVKFKRAPDNSHTPWKHSLTQKLHALQALNPQFEISNIPYPLSIFEDPAPHHPESFESTPFTWVDTPSALAGLLTKLKVTREIAVDLEHHDYRTYAGFVCLMQISTREEDFVVDTLALHDDLEVLNEVFADPAIVKVFHGAEMDVKWLQQDFNLYIVGLFDTFHAACELNFPKKSLAYLLSKFCDFTADKRYQMADWRIRPLPTEMLHYARSDTHFLLFVYDSLRSGLLEHAQGTDVAIRRVLQNSETTAMNLYGADMRGMGESKDSLTRKWNKSLNGRQQFIFDALYAWRDRVAREEDESTRYVLPNHQLFALVEHPPVNAARVLAVAKPTPPLVHARATEVFKVIKDALDAHTRSEADRAKAERAQAVHNGMDIDSGPFANIPAPHDVTKQGYQHIETEAVDVAPLFAASPATLPFVTTSSTFFGKAPVTWKVPANSKRYTEIVDRVHRSLVITPSVPAILKAVSHKHSSDIGLSTEPSIPAEPEQIPFIHASMRQKMTDGLNIKPAFSHIPELEDVEKPEIVAVKGATMQKHKKPKKPRTQANAASGPSSLLLAVDDTVEDVYDDNIPEASGSGFNNDVVLLPKEKERKERKRKRKDRDGAVHQAGIESAAAALPYDYSAAPDILDQGSNNDTQQQDEGKKKRKTDKASKQKVVGLVSGVASGPRQQNQPGSGNRSMTFKS
ncbi:exosome nuclease subunit [Tulasnella sp. 332]|nr:exosome nuclease subunit [Tulasnella sp. 332]